ncbi:MAG: twin-arginine translocase TatA/TatE family subunit [Chitinispirillales bacterium]|jgi:sec-independent protein translocase protein TatA|nr:twin-arginine translocase TatA/TatE family subunit [Chitinispirillales bacterium]
MMGIGAKELLLILLITLVLFGAKRVPELAKGLGSGLREFKKAAKEVDLDSTAAASKSEPSATEGPSSSERS